MVDSSDSPLERILVRGVNWLGDAVMSIPSLIRLKEAYPRAAITLQTPAKLADLWLHHPAVDRTIAFDRSESVWSRARRLRGERFGVSLIQPNSFRSALESWLARIPQRVGYGANGRNWLLTVSVRYPGQFVPMRKRSEREIRRLIRTEPERPRQVIPGTAHHIYHYLHLSGALGASSEPQAPALAILEDEARQALERFEVQREADTPLFGLSAGAEYGPAKCWPAERFIDAAVRIHRQTRCRWLVFGAESEVPRVREIVRGIRASIRAVGPAGSSCTPVYNLAGRTQLRDLCALLKCCDAFLTNDTGPMHLAAAAGTPVVVPFGSTSPELTGPRSNDEARHYIALGNAACAPCFRRICPIDFRCMRSITVEEVVNGVLSASSGFQGKK